MIPFDTAPEADQAQVEIFRRMTPERRLQAAIELSRTCRELLAEGVRSRHPEDYPEYVKGCDIASFDIYPAVHDHAEVAGKLEFVPRGVERLRGWAPGKTVWCCIEASRIDNEKRKVTPAELRFDPEGNLPS